MWQCTVDVVRLVQLMYCNAVIDAVACMVLQQLYSEAPVWYRNPVWTTAIAHTVIQLQSY
jgi:hypothetical protein